MKKSIIKVGKLQDSGKSVTKSGKKQTDLKYNASLYFQIGLIICLLGSYLALESKSKVSSKRIIYQEVQIVEDIDYTESNFEVYREPTEKISSMNKIETQVITEVIQVTDNDAISAKNDVVFITTQQNEFVGPARAVLSTNAPDLNIEKPEEPVSILAVQFVPVYPGCESETTNLGRRHCMSEKLGRFVKKQFDADLAPDLGLIGRQKIDVLFKINKQGEVVVLKTRAPRIELEKEARRVISDIPRMQPGKNGDSVVEVLYSLPIIFDIQN
ncbi:hypothetical protein ES677_10960 [Bizionia gelidisalsuginis]|uniref:TonB C-terminal domain-containing protein n=2 Tax=Bizionia TaxID=283785 RepID=A0A8H2QIN7_9FLAO|nr:MULTISPECIES: hypothetical protein [Bizionia]TYB72192.1 hypothetical protein ES676_11655 [Bizionia saleffrena]TYC10704.1 hypothetical protein ES677_10960 [Bizionia gelidisalsuginis]